MPMHHDPKLGAHLLSKIESKLTKTDVLKTDWMGLHVLFRESDMKLKPVSHPTDCTHSTIVVAMTTYCGLYRFATPSQAFGCGTAHEHEHHDDHDHQDHEDKASKMLAADTGRNLLQAEPCVVNNPFKTWVRTGEVCAHTRYTHTRTHGKRREKRRQTHK